MVDKIVQQLIFKEHKLNSNKQSQFKIYNIKRVPELNTIYIYIYV